MKDPHVRYLGFQVLSNGGRRFDFSFSGPGATLQMISVEASPELLSGPDHMAIQECAGICYETLKSRVVGSVGTGPVSIALTPADVAQHRKRGKIPGRRPNP